MEALDTDQTRSMFLYIADKIIENKPLLTEIDSKIGDGDHGIGMSLGFRKVKEQLEKAKISTINEVFSITGMTMINTMGGASGIIFGLMFSAGVKEFTEKKQLDLVSMSQIFERSLLTIKERGKADLGDKTMIDALGPAVLALKASASSNDPLLDALKKAEESAKEGMEKTKGYIAKFGKAKTLFERALGFQDAGATSVWLIFKAMREWVKSNS
jgi:dihydroxyacetone kinase phosphoprotein-dependent L subunit